MRGSTGELRQVRGQKKQKKKGKSIWRTFVRKAFAPEQDYFDYNLLAAVILLTSFGLIMLYSTSAYEAMLESTKGSTMGYFGKQAVISAAALVLALIGTQIDYHFLAKYSALFYWISIVLLFVTKFIGEQVNGATRWIKIGPIQFQPAEFAKLAIILFLPVVILNVGKQIRTWKTMMMVGSFGLLSAAFTYVFTDNLSTAIIIAGITAGLIFIASPKTKQLLAVAGGVAAAAAVFVMLIIRLMDGSESFRIRRIKVWLEPEAYAKEGGYQVMQALYAIGSGGFFGKGLGKSAQKLGAIPEAQNDMIFSIICEELGVFGAALMMLLFVFLLYRLFVIAQNAPDLLGSLIVVGIFLHIAIQLVLNIAVVVNLIPTTGITLPFVSYGGTSILFLMAEMSLALGVSRQIRFS